MKKIPILCLIIFTVAFYSCKKDDPVTEETQQTNNELYPELKDGDYIPGQYIVLYSNEFSSEVSSKLKSEMEYDEMTNEIAKETATILSEQNIPQDAVINTFGSSLMGFTAKLNTEELNKLKGHKYILHIEQDRVISLSRSLSKLNPSKTPQIQNIPWGIERVGRGNGTGKTIWILDSGVDADHPDLNVDRKRSVGFLGGRKSGNFDDQYGHGTHVAGIIAAKDNDIGVVGVAAGATVVSIKVLDKTGRGIYSDVINAVNYVANLAKPGDVVNLSLNGDTSFVMDRVIFNAASQGIYFTLSAGNSGDDSKYYSPGRLMHENVYTVSAMGVNNKWALFSNFGNPPIDFCAPGVEIYSTFKGGGYSLMDGTSMAAPHVAGILLINEGIVNTDGFVENDIDGVPDPVAHK